MATNIASTTELVTRSRSYCYVRACIPAFFLLVLFLGAAPELFQYVIGPKKMTVEQLVALTGKNAFPPYVTVSGTSVARDSHWRRMAIKKKDSSGSEETQTVLKRQSAGDEDVNQTTEYQLILPIGTKGLIVESKGFEKKAVYAGELRAIDPNLLAGVQEELNSESGDRALQLLPMSLQADKNFYHFPNVAFFAALIGLFVLRWLWRARKFGKDVLNTSLAKNLSKYGNPRDLVPELDKEIIEMGPIGIGNDVAVVLKNWVIFRKEADLIPCNFSDVVWAYETPINGTHTLIVKTKDKQEIRIKSSQERNLADAINLMAERAPWIETGFNGTQESAWKTRPDEVIRLVEAKEKEEKSSW